MNYFSILIGGAIGAFLRFGLAFVFPYQHWTTLGVNLVGCLMLGFFLTWAGATGKISEPLRLGIGTGLLGGFTTFSTFSVEGLLLLQNVPFVQAALYLVASLLGGVLCAWLGYLFAQKMLHGKAVRRR